jgi:hypothetical protein
VHRDDAAVDALLRDHTDTVAATARRLRTVVLDAQPQLSERVRTGWHSLNYRDPDAGFVCAVFPGADRVQLVFEHGARLPDPRGLLTGTGRQVRVLLFATPEDVDPGVVTEFLDLAVDLRAARRR